MVFPQSYLLFFFSLILGTVISISSPSWFGAWVGLELNMMSFIPLITLKMNPYYSESALKYFLIQALSSSLFIASALLISSFFYISSIFILLSILLKLASAPFHFWLPQVMNGLNWPQVFILSTIQKVAPMILLSYLMSNLLLIKMTILSAIFSAILGALGGLNLTYLRKIIAFSSINHMSWMLIAISLGDTLWMIYFFIYSLILFSITTSFSNLKASTLSDLIQADYSSPLNSMLISFSLLSLGGLPPFTGFIPKWFMIQIMVNMNLWVPLFFLLLSALITLYFYLRIVIMFIITLNPTLNSNFKYKSISTMSFSSPIKMSLNLMGMLLPFYFMIM
uniref:NADH dehydrogenase subunit 2 n=1 Tax=Xenophthalmus pinnotheroides TaxID=585961 RepID=UPI0020286765|nr:NADH dehydrogenase subunit 2 [Xenophthalmus pinnotheroides]UPL64999.1 NADH dehydrogenase subunit 2 [Xenophthalmus pinnotheroides]